MSKAQYFTMGFGSVLAIKLGMNSFNTRSTDVLSETRPTASATFHYLSPHAVSLFHNSPDKLKGQLCKQILKIFQMEDSSWTALDEAAELAKCVTGLRSQDDVDECMYELMLKEMSLKDKLQEYVVFSPQEIEVQSARSLAGDTAPTLESTGFVLVQNHIPMPSVDLLTRSPPLEWLAWAERLVRDNTGARHVFAFHPSVRHRVQGSSEIASYVHCDFTPQFHHKLIQWFAEGCRSSELAQGSEPDSLRQRMYDAGVTEQDLSNARIMVLNVWCGLELGDARIHNFPMAFCDWRTVTESDVLRNRFVAFRPRHRWFWFPEVAMNDVLVFSTYDSHQVEKGERASGIPHTAIDHPQTLADSSLQRSYDVKVLCLFPSTQ